MVTRKRVADPKECVKESNTSDKSDDKPRKEVEDSKGSIHNWKRIFINICKVLLVIIVLPAFLNFSALVREEKELFPDGVLIDIRHGQKLFKSCNGSGSLTVILDAPGG